VKASNLSKENLERLRDRIRLNPERWVGQEFIDPSSAPVLGADGFEPRSTVLRTFTVAVGDQIEALPGGLARSAHARHSAIATRTGAVAKDVWITGGAPVDDVLTVAPIRESPILVGATVPAARAAQHLYWLGRYAERAEATVRLIRVVTERTNEFQDLPAGPGAAALTALFETLTRTTATFPGFVGDDAVALRVEPASEMLALLRDSDRVGTVGHCLVHMFDAIDVLRDQLSIDTWLVVSSLQRELEALQEVEPDQQSDDLTGVHNDLLEGLLALSGVGSESTVRDQAWHFTEAGRRIERALQIMALLTTTLGNERGAAAESLVLESVLTASESIITYRRRYRSHPRVASALELLLHDRGNPRSVRYQIETLRDHIPALDPAAAAPSHNAIDIVNQLSELFDEAQVSILAAPDHFGRRQALDDLGQQARRRLHELSDLIAARYFVHILPQRSMVTPVDTTVSQ